MRLRSLPSQAKNCHSASREKSAFLLVFQKNPSIGTFYYAALVCCSLHPTTSNIARPALSSSSNRTSIFTLGSRTKQTSTMVSSRSALLSIVTIALATAAHGGEPYTRISQLPTDTSVQHFALTTRGARQMPTQANLQLQPRAQSTSTTS